MKLIKLSVLIILIVFILSPVYSQNESKSKCINTCQTIFRNQLTICRENYVNTNARTACLDKERILLHECIDTCRDID